MHKKINSMCKENTFYHFYEHTMEVVLFERTALFWNKNIALKNISRGNCDK